MPEEMPEMPEMPDIKTRHELDIYLAGVAMGHDDAVSLLQDGIDKNYAEKLTPKYVEATLATLLLVVKHFCVRDIQV